MGTAAGEVALGCAVAAGSGLDLGADPAAAWSAAQEHIGPLLSFGFQTDFGLTFGLTGGCAGAGGGVTAATGEGGGGGSICATVARLSGGVPR